MRASHASLPESIYNSLRPIKHTDLEIEKNESRSGGQGLVYKGKFKVAFDSKTDVLVAVKTIHDVNKTITSCVSEIKTIENILLKTSIEELKQAHIVAVYGKIVDFYSSKAIVLEWMDTDLYKIIHQPPNGRKFQMEQRCDLLRQASKGLAFLHSHEIIHRDIKPSNLLVDNAWKILKICDFGFSKIIKHDMATHTPAIGTFQYMAPEVYGTGYYTISADVYSFSITAYETLFLRNPYPIVTYDVLYNVAKNNARPKFDENDSLELRKALEKGWSARKEERPAMAEFEIFFKMICGTPSSTSTTASTSSSMLNVVDVSTVKEIEGRLEDPSNSLQQLNNNVPQATSSIEKETKTVREIVRQKEEQVVVVKIEQPQLAVNLLTPNLERGESQDAVRAEDDIQLIDEEEKEEGDRGSNTDANSEDSGNGNSTLVNKTISIHDIEDGDSIVYVPSSSTVTLIQNESDLRNLQDRR